MVVRVVVVVFGVDILVLKSSVNFFWVFLLCRKVGCIDFREVLVRVLEFIFVIFVVLV